MIKVKQFKSGLKEYYWSQKYSCNHTKYIVVIRKSLQIVRDISKELKEKTCPSCVLNSLSEL